MMTWILNLNSILLTQPIYSGIPIDTLPYVSKSMDTSCKGESDEMSGVNKRERESSGREEKRERGKTQESRKRRSSLSLLQPQLQFSLAASAINFTPVTNGNLNIFTHLLNNIACLIGHSNHTKLSHSRKEHRDGKRERERTTTRRFVCPQIQALLALPSYDENSFNYRKLLVFFCLSVHILSINFSKKANTRVHYEYIIEKV